jgi:ribonuclease G
MSESSHSPAPDAGNGDPTDPAQFDAELTNPPPVTEPPQVNSADLKNGAVERSKQRPLLQKILSVFQKQKASYRELIINSR